jgi:hypothetical protein
MLRRARIVALVLPFAAICVGDALHEAWGRIVRGVRWAWRRAADL